MGDLIAVASDGGRCTVWNPDTGQDVATLTDTGTTHVLDDAKSAVAWHPSGKLLATTNGEGTCIIWKLDIAEKFTTLTGHTAAVTGAAWSPDGTLVATSSNDRTCIIWNPHTAEPITITDHARAVTGVAWHPDGDFIATADVSGLIRISHLDGTLERAFISVRPRVPGVESYASWTPAGLDVLEGEAWRVLRVPEPEDGN